MACQIRRNSAHAYLNCSSEWVIRFRGTETSLGYSLTIWFLFLELNRSSAMNDWISQNTLNRLLAVPGLQRTIVSIQFPLTISNFHSLLVFRIESTFKHSNDGGKYFHNRNTPRTYKAFKRAGGLFLWFVPGSMRAEFNCAPGMSYYERFEALESLVMANNLSIWDASQDTA
jgi:hypothetical protein